MGRRWGYLPEISERSRSTILEVLRSGPKTVGEIVELTSLKQPNVSNHLSKLRDEKIVTASRSGRQVTYALTAGTAAALPRFLLPVIQEESAPIREEDDLRSCSEQFFNALIARSSEGAKSIVLSCLETKTSLYQLYEGVFRPALYKIGDWYTKGQLTEAEEHFASSVTERLMSFALQFYAPEARNGRRAVLGCVEGNYHEVGLRMIADVLDLKGWETRFLGANVPTSSFAALVSLEQPDLVMVSCATKADLAALNALLPALRRAYPAAKIWVGGLALAKDEHKQADFVGNSLEDVRSALAKAFPE